MGLLEKICNFFQPVEPKTIVVTDVPSGGVIPLESLNDQVILLPCPFSIRLTGACICATCDFVKNPCPLEMLCRKAGCEGAFIKGCTSYKNENERNCDEKRKVFRYGSAFDGGIFRFGEKENRL